MDKPHDHSSDLSLVKAKERYPKLLNSLDDEIRDEVRAEVKRGIEPLHKVQQDRLAKHAQLEAALASLQAHVCDATPLPPLEPYCQPPTKHSAVDLTPPVHHSPPSDCSANSELRMSW